MYWEPLRTAPALQVVAHRIVWSCLVLIPIVMFSGQWSTIRKTIAQPAAVARLGIAAILVCANWLGFVWAVTHDRMVESSLGYFINPLLNVLFAVVFLGERLRWVQWIAIGVATCGVIRIGMGGTIPWIAFILATTFCLYGIAKKTTKIHPVSSLAVETWLLAIPALLFLLYEHQAHRGVFLNQGSFNKDCLLVGAGIVTTLPLLCFAAGAQRIPFSTIGLLQYIGPTIQFILGVLVYQEDFPVSKRLGFGLVWIALAIYALDTIANRDKGNATKKVEDSIRDNTEN